MNTIIVNSIGREKRFALLRKNKVEKIVIEQPKQQSLVGGIFFGTVEKVLPGMNAAFINIGLEKNGFLHRDKLPAFLTKKEERSISSYLHQGQKLLVQLEKDASGDKGPRLTGIIEFGGALVVYEPEGHYVSVSKKIANPVEREKWRTLGFQVKQENEGILFRTSCETSSEDKVLAELTSLRENYERMIATSRSMKKPGLVAAKNSFIDELVEEVKKMRSGRVIVDTLELKQELTAFHGLEDFEIQFHHDVKGIFSTYRVEYELEKALQRTVWLESGAYLVFDEAEALTIIDVNTGKFSGKNERQETVLKTNELAADEIARQIRLRDLAGMILIDFIDMENEIEREKVRKRLERGLGVDGKRTRIIGFTPLGILQLTRKKERVSLTEGLTESCPVCEGAGRVLSPETVAYQLERELFEYRGRDEEAILIETTEEVRAALVGGDEEAFKGLEEFIGFKIYFTINTVTAKPYYYIRQVGSVEEMIARGKE